MRHFAVIFLLALAVLIPISSGWPQPTHAQTPPPALSPTPVATPTPTPGVAELAGVQSQMDWLRQVWDAYGWWSLGIVVLIGVVLVVRAFGTGILTGVEKQGEKVVEFLVVQVGRITAPGRLNPALKRYLESLQQTYGRLPQVGVHTEQVILDIDSVYIPLQVVDRTDAERYYQRMRGTLDPDAAREGYRTRAIFTPLSDPDLLRAAKQPSPPQMKLPDGKLVTLPRPPMRGDDDAEREAAPRTFSNLLLIGDAGSGKTTTLRYAALRCAQAYVDGNARALRKDLDLLVRRPLFPIYVRLSQFALALPNDIKDLDLEKRDDFCGASPTLFLKWLDTHVEKLGTVPLSNLIKAKSACLILLDGLDEAGQEQHRAYITALITALVQQYPQHRYVVSSRPAGYGGRAHLPDFVETHLSPLDGDGIRDLIRKWYAAVDQRRNRDAGLSQGTTLSEKAEELWQIIQRNSRLFEMASNPLLATAMALLQFNNVKLPDQRAKLYEKLVELLLDLWRKNKDKDLLQLSSAKLAEERRRIHYLALRMQQRSGQVRDVSLIQAQEWLRPYYIRYLKMDHDAADQKVANLLASLALDSGMLQQRDDIYSFTHYTFQEYLAACGLEGLDTEQDPLASVDFLVARAQEQGWREVILLAAGYWSNSGSEQMVIKAQRLIQRLLDAQDDACTFLAADALADIGSGEDLKELTDFPQLYQTVVTRLPHIAFSPTTHPDPVLRNRAATMLDRLAADTERPGLVLTRPDYWATPIAPGTFSMGDDNSKNDREKPQFDYTISRPYALARFPVTNRQYLEFLEALAGRGAPAAVAAARQLQALMAQHQQRGEEFRPRSWPGSRYRPGEGNHPVVNVTWYAASAFAWWADAYLRGCGVLAEGEAIRLPTEAEWERAAAYPPRLPQGNSRAGRRTYPWGADLTTDALQANIDVSKIGGTSVVGIFPHGVAACGAEEMAGNVWEWCSTPPLKYPFAGEVHAESPYTKNNSSSKTYVLRGGSWSNTRDVARCAFRVVLFPALFYVTASVFVLPVCSPRNRLNVFSAFCLFVLVKGLVQLCG
ncbi:NACHT domain-containing protein [Candidatus Oscillochloris fontis]|uniref:NACHT domain-containing protein n=1 Tax=Candidatus Oscillochloris fontis TaxID=2496868 RepID=UPI00101D8551|nr:SUMF1/EgtB/PvdO family nonheme iron enzyme [Candidatus Oscillochloris fontis]